MISDTLINTYTTSNQTYPVTAALTDGGFVISWQSTNQNSNDGFSDIYAQRYAANGEAQGNEFRVNTTTTNTQGTPSIAALADGGFVVTWGSNGQDGDSYGVYAQRYDASGAAQGNEFLINTTTANNQSEPSVTALADGGFVVSWASLGQDPGW